MITTQSYLCTTCGEQHSEVPLSIAFALPDFANQVPVWEKSLRIKATEDWCIVDEKHYYIRGCLEVPVQDSQDSFVFGAWCAIGEEDFYTIMDLWETLGRQNNKPYDITLANSLPIYPETKALKGTLQLRKVGQRPLIFADPDSTLGKDQAGGMSNQTLIHIAQVLAHK